MKSVSFAHILALVFGCGAIHAASIEMGQAGHLEIDAPSTWEIKTSLPETGIRTFFTVEMQSPKSFGIKCFISVSAGPDLQSLTKSQLLEDLQADGDDSAKEAVEGKATLIPLDVPNGFGAYYILTDKALVGKAAMPDNHKIMAQFRMKYEGNIIAIATVFGDDMEDPEFREAIKAVSTMRPVLKNPSAETYFSGKKKPIELEATKTADGTVIGNPYLSPLSLFVPSKSYDMDHAARGAGRGNPRYFMGRDKDAELAMSGWFRHSYPLENRSSKMVWNNAIPKGAKNINNIKINDWNVMLYDLALPATTEDDAFVIVTLKAYLLRARSWIDLHLSAPGHATKRIDIRKKLTDYIKAMRVDAGKTMGFQVEVSSKGTSIISPDENPGRLLIKSRSLSVTKEDTPSKPGFFTLHDHDNDIKIIAWLRP